MTGKSEQATRKEGAVMSRDKMFGALIGVVAGAIAGAAAALLFAPASGRETQQKIRRGAERGWDEAKAAPDKALGEIRKAMDKGLSEVKSQIAQVSKKVS